MTLSEQSYSEIAKKITDIFSIEIKDKKVNIFIPQYSKFFIKNGTWDNRRKYFTFKIKIYNKEKSIIDLGKTLVKIGLFMQDNNDEKIYMQSDFFMNNFYGIDIILKFIPYELAAKRLLRK